MVTRPQALVYNPPQIPTLELNFPAILSHHWIASVELRKSKRIWEFGVTFRSHLLACSYKSGDKNEVQFQSPNLRSRKQLTEVQVALTTLVSIALFWWLIVVVHSSTATRSSCMEMATKKNQIVVVVESLDPTLTPSPTQA